MTKQDAEFWMEALVPLIRRAVKALDQERARFYRSMYWGANHVAHPMGFLR